MQLNVQSNVPKELQPSGARRDPTAWAKVSARYVPPLAHGPRGHNWKDEGPPPIPQCVEYDAMEPKTVSKTVGLNEH